MSDFGKPSELYQPLTLPTGPDTIVAMDQPGDSIDLYRQAIEDYQARKLEYAKLALDETPHTERFKAFDLIARAGKRRQGGVLAPWAIEGVLRFGPNDREPLLATTELSNLTLQLGVNAYRAGRNDEARRWFEAVFTLGAKLWEERLVKAEAQLGVELMSNAAAGLSELAKARGDVGLGKLVDAFLDGQRRLFVDRFEPTWKVLADTSDQALSDHAGDYFAMASDRMQERMWRVEATFKLGSLRIYPGSLGRRGDQMSATRVTKQMAESEPDPVVRQAAKVASELDEAAWRRR